MKSTDFRRGRFSSATFFGFYFLMFLFPFLALLLLIATGIGWRGITQRSETNSLSLLVWVSFRRHIFLSLISSFVLVISWKISIVICNICHLILVQIQESFFKKILSNLGALSSSRANNERGWRCLRIRP